MNNTAIKIAFKRLRIPHNNSPGFCLPITLRNIQQFLEIRIYFAEIGFHPVRTVSPPFLTFFDSLLRPLAARPFRPHHPFLSIQLTLLDSIVFVCLFQFNPIQTNSMFPFLNTPQIVPDGGLDTSKSVPVSAREAWLTTEVTQVHPLNQDSSVNQTNEESSKQKHRQSIEQGNGHLSALVKLANSVIWGTNPSVDANSSHHADSSVNQSDNGLASVGSAHRPSLSGLSSTRSYGKQLIDKGIIENDGTVNATIENVEKLPTDKHVPKQYEKKSQDFWNVRKLTKVAYASHLVLFAASMIFSASCFSWNFGLAVAGFPLYSICVVLNAIAFQILAFCLAELCSGLPFSGGSYGFVRATIGTRAGMFVGLVESLEYIMTAAVNAIQTTTILQLIFNTDPKYNILWDIVLLIFATSIQIIGGEFYWNCIWISGFLTTLVLLVYGLGALQYFGSYENVAEVDFTFGSGNGFMQGLPNAIWFFVGIEGLPLCCEETHESKQEVPKGIVWGMTIVVLVSLLVYFVAVGVPQTDIFGALYPLTAGYAISWGIELTDTNSRALLILALIPCFSATYSFIFCYGRQMFAMSRSGLLPASLSLTTQFSGTPYVAMMFGASVGIAVIAMIRFAPNGGDIINYVYTMMLLCSVTNYLFQLTAYIILRSEYSMLKRNYESPLGIPGAILAFSIFLLGYIGLLGWTDGIGWSILGVGIWVSLGMLYYFLVSSHKLILSPEENFAMFLLYSLKFSKAKFEKLSHGKFNE